jgi:nucleotide-binding universal stress UspA family protein
MKTVFVATDFSNAAHNALLYAAEFAKHLNARIILFHAYQRVLTSADMVVMETTDDLRQKCKDLLQEEIETIKEFIDVEIEGRLAPGSINATILKAAETLEADYIIVGMKGSGRTVRKLFGSTAIAICRDSHIPVIAVPEFATFREPATIALASDISDETDMHILDPLLVFGQTFKSNIYVVRVTSNVKNEVFARLEKTTRIKWHLKEMRPNFEYLKDHDVVNAL